MSVYHSVPVAVMMDPKYLKFMAEKFGKQVNHILDCPEFNIPVLSKSKATFFTDRIKMVCPLLFPTSSGNLSQEMKNLETLASSNFD